MVSSTKLFAVILLSLFVEYNEVSGYETQHCWSQACRECPTTKEQAPGEQVKCDMSRLVSADWLDSVRPQLPNNFGSNLVDFACIKFVGSDPRATYDTSDIVRGCVIAQSAQGICDSLVGAELARGKTDARCSFCTGDYCNSSSAVASSLLILVVSFIFSRIISQN